MITTIIINAVAVFAGAYILKGVHVKGFLTALGIAILLSLVNAFIKPLIVFLTLPLTIVTLGLFILVINAWMLMLVDKLIDGFRIDSFPWALIFGIVIAIFNGLIHVIIR